MRSNAWLPLRPRSFFAVSLVTASSALSASRWTLRAGSFAFRQSYRWPPARSCLPVAQAFLPVPTRQHSELANSQRKMRHRSFVSSVGAQHVEDPPWHARARTRQQQHHPTLQNRPKHCFGRWQPTKTASSQSLESRRTGLRLSPPFFPPRLTHRSPPHAGCATLWLLTVGSSDPNSQDNLFIPRGIYSHSIVGHVNGPRRHWQNRPAPSPNEARLTRIQATPTSQHTRPRPAARESKKTPTKGPPKMIARATRRISQVNSHHSTRDKTATSRAVCSTPQPSPADKPSPQPAKLIHGSAIKTSAKAPRIS
jgi:hypothetical protein